MPANVGSSDRIVRIVAGMLIAAVPLIWALGAWGSAIAYIVGGVLIATSVFSFCPIYAALGLSTRRPPRNGLTE